MTAQVGDTITLTAQVTDAEDNPLTGGKLIFKLNGATIKDDEEKVIYARTNNGTATITYNIPLNYKTKTYNLTAVYEGNCAHNGYRSSPIELNLTKRQAQFTVTTNSTIKANETTTIKVTVKEKEDTTPINGQYFIKINGKTVKDENDHDPLIPITNNTGAYNFTFGEDYKAKEHTITAVLVNKSYERSESNTSINIEQKTVTININSMKMTQENTIITGTITDEDGRKVAGTNKLAVKIDGITVKDQAGTNIIYNITDGNIALTVPINSTVYTKEKYTIELVTGQRCIYI